jgi:DNA-binding CsgD family transcriptional regulator
MAAAAARDDNPGETGGSAQGGFLEGLVSGLVRQIAAGGGRLTVDVPGAGRVVLIGEAELQALEAVAGSRPLDPPSGRELEVLGRIAEGMPAAAAARSLGLSASTVNQHLATIRRKLGVSRTSDAVAVAIERRWLPAPASKQEPDPPLTPVVDVRDEPTPSRPLP